MRGEIFETDKIVTPFICGFIKPKIYIPIGVLQNELSYILAHERVHIKRLDYLVKPFAFLMLLIHWFNPLMWLSFFLMSKDMEMSCDESVINSIGDEIKANYSHSLLALATGKHHLLSGSPLAFGESNVKARIKNVLSYKKPAFWVVAVALVATAALVVLFTANPKNEQMATTIVHSGRLNSMSFDINATTQAPKDNQIEKYLETIISSPQTSSNPQEYINAHENEYNAILALDAKALPYLFSEFEKGGQTGLNGQIMERLCRNILGSEDIKYANANPQDWYDTYKKHMQRIAAQNSLEWVQQNNPKGSLILS